MRIAVTIIAGGFALVVAVQTRTEHAGTAGWLIALLCIIGAAVAYRRPGFAVAVFGVAALTSFGFESDRHDDVYELWGVASLIVAAMGSIGWREQRRLFRRQLVHRRIDEELVPFDAVPPSRNGEAHLQPPREPVRSPAPRR
jgi:uncharacterized membrane protein YccC